MKYLANTLEREFGLDPKFHEEFSQVFKENCIFLDIKSGDSSTSFESDNSPPTVIIGEPVKKSGIKAFVIMPFVEKTSERQKVSFPRFFKV